MNSSTLDLTFPMYEATAERQRLDVAETSRVRGLAATLSGEDPSALSNSACAGRSMLEVAQLSVPEYRLLEVMRLALHEAGLSLARREESLAIDDMPASSDAPSASGGSAHALFP